MKVTLLFLFVFFGIGFSQNTTDDENSEFDVIIISTFAGIFLGLIVSSIILILMHLFKKKQQIQEADTFWTNIDATIEKSATISKEEEEVSNKFLVPDFDDTRWNDIPSLNIHKEGYLLKLARYGGHLHRRYVILLRDEACIIYFDRQKNWERMKLLPSQLPYKSKIDWLEDGVRRLAYGVIELESNEILDVGLELPQSIFNRVISMKGAKNNHEFLCNNEDDKKEWYKALIEMQELSTLRKLARPRMLTVGFNEASFYALSKDDEDKEFVPFMHKEATATHTNVEGVPLKTPVNQLLKTKSTTRRHIETIFTSVVLTVTLAIAIGSFNILFSGMTPYGHQLHHELSKFNEWWMVVFGSGVGLFLLMFFLDIARWKGVFLYIKYFFILIVISLLVFGGLISVKEYPLAPPLLFILGIPLFIFLVKNIMVGDLGKRLPGGLFLLRLFVPFTVCGLVSLGFWVYWILDGHLWDDELREEYKIFMECPPEEEYCLAAYLLWVSPFVASIGSLCFAFISLFLGRSLERDPGEGGNEKLVRGFVFLVGFILFAVWIGASIAGAETKIATLVEMFSMIGLTIMGFLVIKTMGISELKYRMARIPLLRKMYSVWKSSSVPKGLLILFLFIPYLLFLLFSIINQLFRRCLPFTRDENWKQERNYYLTGTVQKQWDYVKDWKWADVLMKAMYFGIFYVTLIVGVGRLTSILLSEVNLLLVNINIFAVYGLFLLIGWAMFMLPPVPGIPVYLTGGIMMTAAGQNYIATKFGDSLTEGLDFWIAIIISCVFTLICKMIVIPCQQKIIGERLGYLVKVRRLCAVNSHTIKSIKLILQQPGMHLDKVLILCGGPDWPTSVLTGILRQSVWQMMYGSLPIVFLTVPTTMAGGMLLKKGLGSGLWDSISSAMLAIAVMTQSFAFISAMYCIEKTASTKSKEISEMKPDQEVLELEKKEQANEIKYDEVTDWHGKKFAFPFFMKFWLILGAMCMAASCYMMQLTSCFDDFQVTDSIKNKFGEDGTVFDIILYPKGYISLGLFAFSSFIVVPVFKIWANQRFKNYEQLLQEQSDLSSVNP